MRASPTPRGRIAAWLTLAAMALLTVLSARAGLAWVGEPFPGFFLLRNRVIASVSLLGWPVASTPAVFQASVAFTAFVFPLAIAYAVHKRDLFEIDALVQRGFYYAILSGLITAAYLALAALATHGLHLSRFGHSTALSLVFTLVLLIVLSRVRDRIQRLVDVIFGRATYECAGGPGLGQHGARHHPQPRRHRATHAALSARGARRRPWRGLPADA